ncbi:hypothetical protein [Sphingomicrobium nitratireducens]|uniref:hypothetical protein n=1 Tax=Sphingomicrobium nitratireducens TaxID=2964666 RepID=UPI0022403955|nr:hypothetical protein [Sphingomicrobium nitratireducens]
MSKHRRKKAPAPKPPVDRSDWIEWVRYVLLAMVAAVVGVVLYMLFADPSDLSGGDLFAGVMMAMWGAAPLLVAYHASRPRKPRVRRLSWSLSGLVGGGWMLALIAPIAQGEGGSTAALGLLVLPFYLFVGLLVVQLIQTLLESLQGRR